MRLFLGIILLLLCLFIGYCMSGKYHFRSIFFSDFLSFNTLLTQEIAFKQTTIVNIIKNQSVKNDFYYLLNKYISNEIKDFNIQYLTTQEKNFALEYFEKIGRFDKETQLEYLNNVNKIIIEKQQASSLDEKKYNALYIKLSFLIGLILLIIVL